MFLCRFCPPTEVFRFCLSESCPVNIYSGGWLRRRGSRNEERHSTGGGWPVRSLSVFWSFVCMGCASVFGATDAFAVGFVGKRFGVMARSLSEIEPCLQRRAERRGAGGRAHSRRRHDPVVRRQAARLFPAAGGRSGKAVRVECRGPAHRRKVGPDRTRWPAGFVCAWTVGASVPRPKRAKRTVGFRGRMVCRERSVCPLFSACGNRRSSSCADRPGKARLPGRFGPEISSDFAGATGTGICLIRCKTLSLGRFSACGIFLRFACGRIPPASEPTGGKRGPERAAQAPGYGTNDRQNRL